LKRDGTLGWFKSGSSSWETLGVPPAHRYLVPKEAIFVRSYTRSKIVCRNVCEQFFG
jgi:hypothetical protein